jgi:hypothetical protein
MDAVAAQLAAPRLVPVQCCSGGTRLVGISEQDYFIGSELMEPEGADAHYSEWLIRLPNLSIYHEPADRPAAALDRAQSGYEKMRLSVGAASRCQNICRSSARCFRASRPQFPAANPRSLSSLPERL